MIESAIRSTFEQRLDAWAATQDLCVEHQNEKFTPPEGHYLRATLLMAPGVSNDAVSGETHSGVFQVDYMGMPMVGSDAAQKLGAGLRALFPMDGMYQAGSVKIWQRSPVSMGPAIPDANRNAVPFSFRFDAFA